MKESKFATVAVFRPIPSTFEYFIPPKLQNSLAEGSICKVPFGAGHERGVVVEISPQSGYAGEPKPVREMVSPPLPESLLELAKEISYSTFTPLGQVFHRMVPSDLSASPRTRTLVELAGEFEGLVRFMEEKSSRAPKQVKILKYLLSKDGPVAKRKLLSRTGSSPSPLNELKKQGFIREVSGDELTGSSFSFNLSTGMTDHENTTFGRLEGSCNSFEIFSFYGSGGTRWKSYIRILQKLQDEGQIIFLVPDVFRAEEAKTILGNHLDRKCLSYHSRLTEGELSHRWNLALSGEVDIFVGVINAIYLPLSSLSAIIIENEGNRNYELREQDPRGELLEISRKRARLEEIPLIVGGVVPSLRSYLSLKKENYSSENESFPIGDNQKIQVIMESVGSLTENRSLTPGLRKALEGNFRNGKQSLLVGERTGTSGALICKNCGEVYRCPDCEVPLTYTRSGDFGECPYCHFKRNLVECRNCGHGKVKFIGPGLEKVEAEVTALLPGANVRRFDSRKSSLSDFLEVFQRGTDESIDVLVGTPIVMSLFLLEKLTFVGLLDLDLLLNRPTYRSTEFVLRRILRGYDMLEPEGKIFLPVYNPSNPPFPAVEKRAWKTLFQKELKSRQAMNYPPFTELLEVHFRGDTEEEVARVSDQLKEKLSCLEIQIDLLGPAKEIHPRVESEGFQSRLIVKVDDLEVFLRQFHTLVTQKERRLIRLNPYS